MALQNTAMLPAFLRGGRTEAQYLADSKAGQEKAAQRFAAKAAADKISIDKANAARAADLANANRTDYAAVPKDYFYSDPNSAAWTNKFYDPSIDPTKYRRFDYTKEGSGIASSAGNLPMAFDKAFASQWTKPLDTGGQDKITEMLYGSGNPTGGLGAAAFGQMKKTYTVSPQLQKIYDANDALERHKQTFKAFTTDKYYLDAFKALGIDPSTIKTAADLQRINPETKAAVYDYVARSKQFQNQLPKDNIIRTVAPIALSFIPGIGPALGAAVGAGLAASEGDWLGAAASVVPYGIGELGAAGKLGAAMTNPAVRGAVSGAAKSAITSKGDLSATGKGALVGGTGGYLSDKLGQYYDNKNPQPGRTAAQQSSVDLLGSLGERYTPLPNNNVDKENKAVEKQNQAIEKQNKALEEAALAERFAENSANRRSGMAGTAGQSRSGLAGRAGRAGYAEGGVVEQEGIGLLFERANARASMDPILEHHYRNLAEGKAVNNDDGSVSTVYTAQVEIDGTPTLIPRVWDGQILSEKAALERSVASGKTWPTAETHEDLRQYDIELHKEMAPMTAEAAQEALVGGDEAQPYAEGGSVQNVQYMQLGGMASPFADPMSKPQMQLGSMGQLTPQMQTSQLAPQMKMGGVGGLFQDLNKMQTNPQAPQMQTNPQAPQMQTGGVGGFFQDLNLDQMGPTGDAPLDIYGNYLNDTYTAPQVESSQEQVAEFIDMIGQAERAHFGEEASFGYGGGSYQKGLVPFWKTS